MENLITVKTTIAANIAKVWEYWTLPKHIVNWNFATEEWHCPKAENNLAANGKFSWRMEAKDGSMGFDYSGIYEKIELNKRIALRLDDNRKVEISFSTDNNVTTVEENFEPDNLDIEMQKQGWQAILNNFKKYVEEN